jgi:hypothetical protein
MLTANGGHTLTLGKAFEPNIEAEIDTFAVRVPQTVDAGAIRDAAVPYEDRAPGAVIDDILFEDEGDKGASPASEMAVLKEIDFDGVASEGIVLRDPAGANDARTEGADGAGFALDGRSKVIVSDRADAIEGAHAFEMTASIAKDAPDAKGTIMSAHGSMDLSVASDGTLDLWLRTDEGEYRARTEAGTLDGTGWHEVGIRFDGARGEMAIVVDSRDAATAEAHGAMPEDMHHHLMVGRAFGGGLEGRVDDVRLAIGEDCAGGPVCATPHGDWYAPMAAAPAPEMAALALDPAVLDI